MQTSADIRLKLAKADIAGVVPAWSRHEIEALLSEIPLWRPIELAPKDGTHVFVWTREGLGTAWFAEAEDDGPDSMGHDAGWWAIDLPCDPGRHIGNPAYFREAANQPTHWMPLPEPPADAGDDDDEQALTE
jgi:hypothetical protein